MTKKEKDLNTEYVPHDYDLPDAPACSCGSPMYLQDAEEAGETVIFTFDCSSCDRMLGVQVEKDGHEVRNLERM